MSMAITTCRGMNDLEPLNDSRQNFCREDAQVRLGAAEQRQGTVVHQPTVSGFQELHQLHRRPAIRTTSEPASLGVRVEQGCRAARRSS